MPALEHRFAPFCPGSAFFFFNDTATTEIYPLSLHDALPISTTSAVSSCRVVVRTTHLPPRRSRPAIPSRSEEHTSELQSPCNLVCRLLLEKKKLLGLRLARAPRLAAVAALPLPPRAVRLRLP